MSELCEPLIELNHQMIVASNYVQADGTPFQVLKETGRKDTSRSYLWVYRGRNMLYLITNKVVVVIMQKPF